MPTRESVTRLELTLGRYLATQTAYDASPHDPNVKVAHRAATVAHLDALVAWAAADVPGTALDQRWLGGLRMRWYFQTGRPDFDELRRELAELDGEPLPVDGSNSLRRELAREQNVRESAAAALECPGCGLLMPAMATVCPACELEAPTGRSSVPTVAGDVVHLAEAATSVRNWAADRHRTWRHLCRYAQKRGYDKPRDGDYPKQIANVLYAEIYKTSSPWSFDPSDGPVDLRIHKHANTLLAAYDQKQRKGSRWWRK